MKNCRVVTALLFISALLLPAPVIAGALDRGPMQQRYNPAAEEMIRIPGVVGMYEQDALATLQQAGVAPDIKYEKKYNADLDGKEGTVIDQEPGAAGIVMLGSVVSITVYWPPAMGQEPSGGQYGDGGGQWSEPAGTVPPAYEEPAPQWDGGQQPAGDAGWTPPPAPTPEPSVAPATGIGSSPVVNQRIPSGPTAPAPQAVPVPAEPIRATPAPQTVTPVTLRPSAPAETPVQQKLDEKVPARVDIRNKMKGVERKITPTVGAASSPVQGQPADPTVTPTGSATFTATPVQPTATQAEQQPSAPAPIEMTPVQQTVTLQSKYWHVRPWQTDSWDTFYNGQTKSLSTWKYIDSEMHRPYLVAILNGNAAIGNIPTGPNPSQPSGGTAGTFAITVNTPIGELPCNAAAILNSPRPMMMGFFYACMDRFPLTGRYFRGWNSQIAGLPPKGTSRTGKIVSETHKRFLSFYFYNTNDPITITVTKLSGKSRATVVGYIGDLAYLWRPWNCEFDKGKDNIGETCSFTFKEVMNRGIGVRIDGYGAVNHFEYKISTR